MDDITFAAERDSDIQKIIEYCKKFLENNARIKLSLAIKNVVKNKYWQRPYKEWIEKFVISEIGKDKRYKLEEVRNFEGKAIDYIIVADRSHNASLERLPLEYPNKPKENRIKNYMPQKNNNALSPLTWIIISGVGFIIFLIAALLFSLYSDKINFISQSAYFFLLVPLALVAAGFLFGALRSHAKYSGKAYGGTLELSGPVVVLALIIFLGYKFRPAERSFSFTINVFAGNDSSEAIKTGYTELFFGTAHQTKNISEGQAVFSEVPHDYKGKTVTLIAHAEGYKTKKSELIIPYENLPVSLYLQKVPDSVTVTGLVKDKNGTPVKDAVLVFSDGVLKTTSDNYGNFRVSLPYKDGEQVALRVYKADKLRYDNMVTLSEKVSLTIPLR